MKTNHNVLLKFIPVLAVIILITIALTGCSNSNLSGIQQQLNDKYDVVDTGDEDPNLPGVGGSAAGSSEEGSENETEDNTETNPMDITGHRDGETEAEDTTESGSEDESLMGAAEDDENTYTITLYASPGYFENDGTNTKTITLSANTKIGTLPTPVRENYEFVYWKDWLYSN